MPSKKTLKIIVDSGIAEELKMQLDEWVSDFYGEEAQKIQIGELEEL